MSRLSPSPAPPAVPFDVVLNFAPTDWDGMSSEEKAVCALAPIRSLSAVLCGVSGEVDGKDISRIVKALVDRAELIFDVPNLSLLACVPRDME